MQFSNPILLWWCYITRHCGCTTLFALATTVIWVRMTYSNLFLSLFLQGSLVVLSVWWQPCTQCSHCYHGNESWDATITYNWANLLLCPGWVSDLSISLLHRLSLLSPALLLPSLPLCIRFWFYLHLVGTNEEIVLEKTVCVCVCVCVNIGSEVTMTMPPRATMVFTQQTTRVWAQPGNKARILIQLESLPA